MLHNHCIVLRFMDLKMTILDDIVSTCSGNNDVCLFTVSSMRFHFITFHSSLKSRLDRFRYNHANFRVAFKDSAEAFYQRHRIPLRQQFYPQASNHQLHDESYQPMIHGNRIYCRIWISLQSRLLIAGIGRVPFFTRSQTVNTSSCFFETNL